MKVTFGPLTKKKYCKWGYCLILVANRAIKTLNLGKRENKAKGGGRSFTTVKRGGSGHLFKLNKKKILIMKLFHCGYPFHCMTIIISLCI